MKQNQDTTYHHVKISNILKVNYYSKGKCSSEPNNFSSWNIIYLTENFKICKTRKCSAVTLWEQRFKKWFIVLSDYLPNAGKNPWTSFSLQNIGNRIALPSLTFYLLPSSVGKGKQSNMNSLCHSDFTVQYGIFCKTWLNFLFFFYFNL